MLLAINFIYQQEIHFTYLTTYGVPTPAYLLSFALLPVSMRPHQHLLDHSSNIYKTMPPTPASTYHLNLT